LDVADTTNKSEGVVRRRAPPSAHDADSTGGPTGTQSSLQKQREKLQQQRDARALQANISKLTELADELLSRGLTGVYSMTYEALLASTLMWEYRGITDGQIHGPFTAQQLSGWKAQGFFTGPTAVQVRAVGENHTSDMQNAATASAQNAAQRGAAADPAAAAALRAFGARAVPDTDSIYDDEVPSTNVSGTAQPQAPAQAPSVPSIPPLWADWVSSDDVNFGEYANLDQAREVQRQPQQRKQPRTTVHTYDRDSAPAARGASAAGLGSGERPRTGREEGSDNDDDDVEEEAEGMRYRRNKASSRRTKDQPDSDDE
jgi:hypothetical protein